MSGKLVVYGTLLSPPVRAVLLTLKALNLDYELKEVNVRAGEQNTPEYLKKNPQHTIPLLEDNGKYIWDSHAIIAYLASKYGKDETIYPKDLFQRAIVDQRLHYDNGILFYSCMKPILPRIFHGTITKAELQEKLVYVLEQFDILEQFLGDNTYFAGNNLTIADLSIVASLSSLNIILPITADKHPKLAAWFKLITNKPFFQEAVGTGIQTSTALLTEKIAALN